jgi:hypothetical protein
MGCKLGTSVLGLEEDMEAFLDDGVLEKYGVGLFETEEASAETILKSTYLEKGKPGRHISLRCRNSNKARRSSYSPPTAKWFLVFSLNINLTLSDLCPT